MGSRAALPQPPWKADENIRLPENEVWDSGERCSSSGEESSPYLWCQPEGHQGSAWGREEISALQQTVKQKLSSLFFLSTLPQGNLSLYHRLGMKGLLIHNNTALLIHHWNQTRWPFRHVRNGLWCKQGKPFKNYIFCVTHPCTQLTVRCSQRWSSLKRKEALQIAAVYAI